MLSIVSLLEAGAVKVRYCIKNVNTTDNVIFYTTAMRYQYEQTAGNFLLAPNATKTYEVELIGNLTSYSQILVDNILSIQASVALDDNNNRVPSDADVAGYSKSNTASTYYFKPFEKTDFQLNAATQYFIFACALDPSNIIPASRIQCAKYSVDQMTKKLGNDTWKSNSSTVCDNTSIYP